MIGNTNREKINPGMGSKRGASPNWDDLENSRWHWRKTFYIAGKISGKRVKKKRRKFTREIINTGLGEMTNE